MEHSDIRHKLSEYLDSSISAREKTEIENHLKTCQQCSDALQALRKTIEHIKTFEEIDPPAWMTQKIMASVRAEAEGKKSIFQRLFYPLTVKLPIQAIAVLFLAVTGFYIYQNIQPGERLSEAPPQEFAAQNEALPKGTAQDKVAKADGPAVRSKQVPQTPAYKALDMKLEYEKPATPKLQDQAAAPSPSPEKPAEQPALANAVTSEKRSAEPQAVAPAMMREQIAPSAGKAPQGETNNKSDAAQQKRSLKAADGSTSNLSAAKMDGQFQLNINQTISFESDNLRLKLLNVTEDSRCPMGVRCTWEGQVTVLIHVIKQDQDIGDISLTYRSGNYDLATKTFDNYILKLVKVEPYPKQGDTLKSSDYRVTLVLSKI